MNYLRTTRNLLTVVTSLLFGLLVCDAVAAAKPLYVDPACPKPGESIILRAIPVYPQLYATSYPPVISRDGSTFKIVLVTDYNGFSEPDKVGTADIGALGVGTYVVNFYIRRLGSSPQPGPEELVTSTNFVVQENPPACEARHIAPLSYDMISATPGQPYARTLSVRVVDAHGLPVSGVRVHWDRVTPPGEGFPPQIPDAIYGGSGTTNAQGVIAFQNVANGTTGTFQYRASIDYPGLNPRAYFVVSNRPAGSQNPVYPVVEYYNSALQHYFITMNPVEMAKLDSEGSAWERTGGVFLAFGSDPATRPSSAMPVCRFYGLPQAGLDSHFFAASQEECEAVKQRFSASWLFETDNAFAILLPDAQTGNCPAGAVGVHRFYNSRADANHRYAVGYLSLLSPSYNFTSGPWIAEGNGRDIVVMCSPL